MSPRAWLKLVAQLLNLLDGTRIGGMGCCPVVLNAVAFLNYGSFVAELVAANGRERFLDRAAE